MELNEQVLNQRYENLTAVVRCECVFATELVGGQPADEDGIRQFATHHLKIDDPVEREKAVQRILHEEVADAAPEDGELPEGKVYGLRAIRRTQYGPYVGDWMIKACIKQACTRIGLFQEKKGTKGNFAEAGQVRAILYSLQDIDNPNFIYLRNGDGPATTYHKTFQGRVQSPQGAVSITHQSECAAAGTQFAFEYRLPAGKVTLDDIQDVLAMARLMGLGSARSLERGKFRIIRATVEGFKTKEATNAKAVAAKV